MKQLLYCTCLFLVVFTMNASAQIRKIHSDPALAEKFATIAAKNPDYINMRNQMTSLIKTASPKNTNAAAVKNLLIRNSALLKGLYNTAGIEAPLVKRMSLQPGGKIGTVREVLPGKFKAGTPLLKVIKPPYWKKFIVTPLEPMEPDTTLSNFAVGKIGITYSSDDYLEPMEIGLNVNMFKQAVIIPSDPTIVAAEIKLEFSYLYTGWDTYGSVRGLSTLVRTHGLPELYENNPMPVFSFGAGSSWPPYRLCGIIQPMDSILTEFDDFIVSGSDSLVLQRYVTPGQDFNIEYGIAFPIGVKRGTNGCYHYAEMILKKITIRYLKANSN